MHIDILLPFRNAADTLPAALASIAAQTHRDVRLIAIDDGSTDNSPALLRSFPRHALVVTQPPRGLVAALNLGLQHVEAPLVARMDADDVMMPDRLERQARALAEHPDWGAVACRVDYEGTGAGFRHFVEWTNTLLAPEDIALNRFVESPLIHPSICFRTELIRAHGPYRDGDLPEDYELWLRWLEAGVKIGRVPDVLLCWCDREQRLSRSDPRYAVHAFYRLKSEYLARWLAKHNPHHPDVVVWGAGYRTRKRVRLLEAHGVRVKAYVDIDPARRGQQIAGCPVWMPDELPGTDEVFVIPFVGSRGAREQIVERLIARGYVAGRHFICAA